MKHYHSIRIFLLAGLLAFVPGSYAQSNDLLKTSRYSFLSLSPQLDETDILSVVVEIEFPGEIRKVGDALEFLLQNSGYRLEDPEQSGHHQYVLYNFDLPEAHRKLGPMILWDALSVIGNDGFLPWANPLFRTVRYNLDEIYPFVISEAEIACARDKWIHRHSPEYTPCVSIEAEKQQEEPAPASYGPIQNGETLWHIAQSLKMENVALEQIMAAIFYSNPGMFGRNMNVLLEGGILMIPNVDTVRLIKPAEARELVRRHFRNWHGNQGRKNNG